MWRDSQLIRAGARGRGIRVLAGDGAAAGPAVTLFERAAWSPDGRRLAFTGKSDIFVIGASGSGLRRLTRGGRSRHPVWSPDGRWIYFSRQGRTVRVGEEASGREAAIWAMRPDGSRKRAITAPGERHFDLPGSFSPGGTLLAFTRGKVIGHDSEGREHNTREVWTMRPDGSEQRKLAGRSRDPAFAPNGRRIAFASDRDENGELHYGDRVFYANELYVMARDGSRQRRLTRTRGRNELQPAWLPNGRRLAYQAGRNYQNAEIPTVMQANADGSCPTIILAGRPLGGSWYAAPAWRPGNARSGDQRLGC